MSVLIILCVGLSVIRVVDLPLEVRVQGCRKHPPTAKVEEPLVLLPHFEAAFPAKAFACHLLILEVGLRIQAYLTLVGGIFNVLLYRVGCTPTYIIDDGTRLGKPTKLNESLGTVEH